MFTKADKSAPSTFVARAPSTKSDAPFFSSTKDTKATSGGGQSFFAAQPSFAVQPSTAVQASLVVQPKLEVSQPSDPLEHEADAVADEVMSASAPSAVRQEMAVCNPKMTVRATAVRASSWRDRSCNAAPFQGASNGKRVQAGSRATWALGMTSAACCMPNCFRQACLAFFNGEHVVPRP